MSTGKHAVRARMEEALRGFMDREVGDLRHEELEMAETTLRALRADAHAEDNDRLYRACNKALESLRRHRQKRVMERDRHDREHGRFEE